MVNLSLAARLSLTLCGRLLVSRFLHMEVEHTRHPLPSCKEYQVPFLTRSPRFHSPLAPSYSHTIPRVNPTKCSPSHHPDQHPTTSSTHLRIPATPKPSHCGNPQPVVNMMTHHPIQVPSPEPMFTDSHPAQPGASPVSDQVQRGIIPREW